MPRKPTRNTPGRPRGFDEKRALDAATRVFAAKGYESASLADLTSAMGVNRFSLYATFGNKEALFVKAMEHYMTAIKAFVSDCMAANSGRESVERLLRGSAAGFTDPNAHGICFLTQRPLTPEEISEETRQYMHEKRQTVESALSRRFEQAKQEDEIPPEMSAQDLASFYALALQAIALGAQQGKTCDELLRTVEIAIACWPRGKQSP